MQRHGGGGVCGRHKLLPASDSHCRSSVIGILPLRFDALTSHKNSDITDVHRPHASAEGCRGGGGGVDTRL